MPEQIGDMVALQLLNLSHQQGATKFSGGLPSRITLLNNLGGLYLEHNAFGGALPAQVLISISVSSALSHSSFSRPSPCLVSPRPLFSLAFSVVRA